MESSSSRREICSTCNSQVVCRDNVKFLRIILLYPHSVFLLHTGKTDSLDGILCDHDQVLGPSGAALVAAFVIDIKKIVLTVNDSSENCGIVSLLIEFFV